MKIQSATLIATLLFTACGERAVPADASTDRSATAATASAAPSVSNGPCAPLDAATVRYDTRGKPLLFSFEIPKGFEVSEFGGGGTAGVDVTMNLDGKGGPDYVLRFAQNTDQPLNPSTQVELWRKLPMIEQITEHDINGQTMFISRSRTGEMVGFQALFPSAGKADESFLVIAGVTQAPEECREQAAAAVEKILKSFARNPEVVATPKG